VKILVEQGKIKSYKPDKRSQMPLMCSTWNGHEGVVKKLHEETTSTPNTPNNAG